MSKIMFDNYCRIGKHDNDNDIANSTSSFIIKSNQFAI